MPLSSCARLAALLFALISAGAAAAGWQVLGPFSETTRTILSNPARNVIYARQDRIYFNENDSPVWSVAAPLPAQPACKPWDVLMLSTRADGDIFVVCVSTMFRSRDDGRTWTPYLTYAEYAGPNGPPAFDPTRPGRMVQRTAQAIVLTEDDGQTWRTLPQEVLAPRYLAFDPRKSGRLVALDVQTYPGGGASLITGPVLLESPDFGATWRFAGALASTEPRPDGCYPEELVFGASGALFANTYCGSFRSLDGGVTWSPMTETLPSRPPGTTVTGFDPTGFTIDSRTPGHVLAWSEGRVIESFDDGAQWSTLPAVPGDFAYAEVGIGRTAVGQDGRVLAATTAGVFQLNRANGGWEPRVVGQQGVRMVTPEIIPAQPPRLVAPRGEQSSMSSDDGGLTWQKWTIGSQSIRFVHANAIAPVHIFASTDDYALYRSPDGGRNWVAMTAAPALAQYQRVFEKVVPVGPQPGLVYALNGYCRESGFTGCFWTPREVLRSVDGGASWKTLLVTGGPGEGGMPPIASGPVASQLAVSPAAPDRLMVLTTVDVRRSRDRGETWEEAASIPSGGAKLSADPVDPNKWYALLSNTLFASSDFGGSWTKLAVPATTDGFAELLVDPRVPTRQYLVTREGAVHVSEDRGLHWRVLLDTTAGMLSGARLAPLAANAIYAGSEFGVRALQVAVPTLPASLSAVEYYRADSDHYFITADPEEIAKLDRQAGLGGPFARTGQSFGVWPATASDDNAASVCRFYGRPEANLDSHFFSASPRECAEVISSFADSWLLEATRVFAVALPTSQGICPASTAPIYRLFNQRADANHRYTTSSDIRNDMRSKGWVAEGYGAHAVAMCGPQ